MCDCSPGLPSLAYTRVYLFADCVHVYLSASIYAVILLLTHGEGGEGMVMC